MLKKESGGSLSINPQCRTCIHHERVAHPSANGKVCAKMGVLGTASACKLYDEDVLHLAKAQQSTIKIMRLVCRELGDPDLQVLAMAVRNIPYLKKAGYEFGQLVYFAIGTDYLQNWFRGRVVKVSKDRQFIHICSSLTEGADNSMITLEAQSVFTAQEFEKKRRSLVKENRIAEPRKNGRPTLWEELQMPKAQWKAYRESLAAKPADYEPPTLDSVPQHWLDKRTVRSFKDEAAAALKANVVKSKVLAKKKLEARAKRNAQGAVVISRT